MFLIFCNPDYWEIIQQLGTEAKPSVRCGLNISQPNACQKVLTKKTWSTSLANSLSLLEMAL
jgi:hypothetical protein